MMLSIHKLLLLLAFLCFVLDAFGVPSRIRFVSTGLALWVLSVFV